MKWFSTKKLMITIFGMVLLALTLSQWESASVFAAEKLPDRAYQTQVDKFFDTLQKKGSSKAIDELFAGTLYGDREQLRVLKSQYLSAEELMDDLIDHSIFTDELITERLAYVSVIVNYERQPLRIEMFFYRPHDEWLIHNFQFDDRLLQDIAASGRASIMRIFAQDAIKEP